MKKQSILTTALIVGLSLPAFAQDGFRVGVQLGSMKTTGDAATFGYTEVTSGPAQSVSGHNFDQATQSPLSLDLAWVKGDDEWSLTYFSSKKKTSKTMIDAANGVYIAVFPFSLVDAGLSASRDQKVTLIDLNWKHTLVKSDAGSFAFSAGLRSSKVSDERTYQQLNAAGTPEQTNIHMKGEGTGFGLTMGLHGRMNFNDRFWMTTGFTAAMLSNTNKTDDYTLSGGGPNTIFNSDDARQSLLQTDAYLRVNMNFVKSFNGYLGYEVRNFGSDNGKIKNAYTDLGLPTTSGFGLSGLTLGLSYTF
jgi:hypothetical protein